MKILLVYPQYPDTFWSFKHVLKFIKKKAAYPPLGLLTVAAILPKRWEKRLIDLNVTNLTDEDILWSDMVFISAMLIQKISAEDIIKRCNLLGRKVVAGGPAFTTQYQNFQGVDHFVLNEAEITLPLFLDDLKKGKIQKIYTSNDRPNITSTPIPLWSLINFNDYASMAVQFSRGCPFECEFCDIIIMNGRVSRTKSPEQFIAEIQSLYDYGWRGSLFIVDDNFIGNKINVKKMLVHLIKWQKRYGYPLKFFTEASINLAEDEKLMQMMSAANFYKVFLGLETPNINSLKECSKIQNTRDLAKAVNIIHQNGMQVMGGFIVGFDNDCENIFETQIRFIQQIGVVTAMVGILSALPQTRLWHRLKAEGRLTNVPSGENTDGSLNFIPKMGKEKLIAGYKRILATIYAPKAYYKRINTFIKNYKPTVKSKLSQEDLRAFFRSIWRIGIFSRAGFRYWKLIIKTSITKKKALPIAVELAIIGLHFEKIAKKILEVSG